MWCDAHQSSTLASFYGPRLPHRTSEIRHTDSLLRYFLRVVPTGTVSEVFPDLPQYPSHTPNELQGAPD